MYKEQYDKAVKSGKVMQVNYTLKTDWTQGETVIGKLESIGKVHFDETNSDCNTYLFDTDAGLIQMVLGAGVDMQADDIFNVGSAYAITFTGIKDISGGRRLKMYNIEYIPPETE